MMLSNNLVTLVFGLLIERIKFFDANISDTNITFVFFFALFLSKLNKSIEIDYY